MPYSRVLIGLLAAGVPYGAGFIAVTALGLLLLPGAAWLLVRALGVPSRSRWLAPVATVPIVALPAYGMYTGDPLPTLAGDFAFAVGLALGLAFLASVVHAGRTHRRRWLPAALLVPTVATHVVAALLALVGASAWRLTRDRGPRARWVAGLGGVGVLLATVVALPLDGRPLCGRAVPPLGAIAAADDGRLRVATFNLLHDFEDAADRTLGRRLELAADALHAAGADVVGAQEVVRNATDGAVARRLAEELAQRSGDVWYWCWSQSNPFFPGDTDFASGGGGSPLSELMVDGTAASTGREFREGLAIVSRFVIVDRRFRRLPPRPYEAPFCIPPDPLDCNLSALFDARQVLWARLEPGGAPAFDFFTTHIAHGLTPLSSSTKLLQIEAVLSIVEEWHDEDAPAFLVGDFNSQPGTARYDAVLDAGFVDAHLAAGEPECGRRVGAGCTADPPAGEEVLTRAPRRAMERRIDYVFARGCSVLAARRIGAEPAQVMGGRDAGRWLWPSDHLGVVATVSCRHEG